MVRDLVDSEILATKPGESEPFVTIDPLDIGSVVISERINDAMDSAEIRIDNADGQYSSANGEITSGDKLVFRAQLDGEEQLSEYWTGIVRNPTDILGPGGIKRREIDATDFVFTILSWRNAYQTFEDRAISGNEDAILNTLLTDLCPEIGQSQIETINKQTDAFLNGRDLYSVVAEDLADIAQAVVGQDGEDIIFKPLDSIVAKHALTPSDFFADIEIERNDDSLANLVRIDGGTDHASDDEQPVQDDYQRVTNTERLTTRIRTRKSEIDRVLVHVRADDASSDDIRVRLQANRDGEPVAIDDTSSDIAFQTLPSDFLATDGLTTFVLSSHTLPPGEQPWLIIEARGETGHEIGVDDAGEPTYRAEYPFPLLARSPSDSSQQEFRRRDHRIKDESLGSLNAVNDKAISYLRRHREPEKTVIGEAQSLRAHRLSPGEAVDMVGWDSVGLSGVWICRERETDYGGSSTTNVRTTLTLQEASTV